VIYSVSHSNSLKKATTGFFKILGISFRNLTTVTSTSDRLLLVKLASS